MRLKFQVSRSTNLKSIDIKESILKKLKDDEYRIVSINDMRIKFDDGTFGIWPRQTYYFRQLRQGVFEINILNGETIVYLKFQEWILVQTVIIAVFLMLTIKEYSPFHIIFCAIIFIGKFLRIIAIKDESKIILREILGQNRPDSTD